MKKNKILLSIALCLVAFASMFTMFIPKTKVSAADYNGSLHNYQESYDSIIPFKYSYIRMYPTGWDSSWDEDVDNPYPYEAFPVLNTMPDEFWGNNSIVTSFNFSGEYYDSLCQFYGNGSGYFYYARLSGYYPVSAMSDASYIGFVATNFAYSPELYNDSRYTLVAFSPGSASNTTRPSWRVSIRYYTERNVLRQSYAYPTGYQFYIKDVLDDFPAIKYIESLEIQCYIEQGYSDTFLITINDCGCYSNTLSAIADNILVPGEVVYEVNWFESIVDSVDSLLSIEILPEISFYDILIVCVCIPLLVAILKAWLGG